MIKIALVDDDVNFQNQLKRFIARYFNGDDSLYDIECFWNGIDFLTDYKCNCDLVIMDIRMPMMDGMEVAKKLRKIDKNVLIVFITETANFAIKGYSVSAFDYVLKPLQYETNFKYKFSRIVKLLEERKPRGKDMVVNDDYGKIVKINTDDLIYVVKEKDTALYHTKRGVFRKRIPLFKIEEELPSASFALANSGCLVNLSCVASVDGTEIQLVDGKTVVLSRSKKKAFYDKFFLYVNSYGGDTI